MGLYAMALYATAEAAFAKLFPKTIERFRTEPGVVYYHAEEVFDSFIAGYNFGRCELIDEITAPFRTRAETAERERDEARAEVERLRAGPASSWNPLVQYIATMPADDAKVIDELAEFDAAREEGAASERAAIVAYIQWRFESLEALSYVELDRLVDAIESLDHHRDGGTP